MSSLAVHVDFMETRIFFPAYLLPLLLQICEGEHTDIDESAAQHSMSSNLAVPSSPAVNFELKRKVEELEKQIADERKKFQVVADRLAEQQVEADKNVQQMQDDWDGKIRELQKEKYALSIRLQVCFNGR